MAFVLCSFVAWHEFGVKYVDAAAAAARNSPSTRARPRRSSPSQAFWKMNAAAKYCSCWRIRNETLWWKSVLSQHMQKAFADAAKRTFSFQIHASYFCSSPKQQIYSHLEANV
jgi:hypothetical protein